MMIITKKVTMSWSMEDLVEIKSRSSKGPMDLLNKMAKDSTGKKMILVRIMETSNSKMESIQPPVK